MVWGSLSPAQRAALLHHLAPSGRVVDLGAGDGGFALGLLHGGRDKPLLLGVTLTCVDCAEGPRYLPSSVRWREGSFADLPAEPADLALLSWPANRRLPGLLQHLDLADKVAYLGRNHGGTACGHPELFKYLCRRELLEYVPHRTNTLVVVGKPLPGPRHPTGEEAAGLVLEEGGPWEWETVLEWDAAVQAAREGRPEELEDWLQAVHP